MGIEFGKKIAPQRMICGACSHGKRGDFYPLEAAEPCPICSNERRHTPLSQHLEALVGQSMWLVTDHNEKYIVIPVVVKRITGREVVMALDIPSVDGEIAESFDYYTAYASEVYADRADAEKEAAHRNHKEDCAS